MMIVLESEGITLRINENVINIMTKFIQNDKKKNESGGIIVGLTRDNNIYEITDISTPSKFDISTRFSFLRSRKSAQSFIDKCYKKSNNTKVYLGEWHTHPEDFPSPSGEDISSITKSFTQNELNSDTIFSIIVGIKTIYIGIMNNDRFKKFGEIEL